MLRHVGMGREQAGRERKAGWKHAHGLGAWGGRGGTTPGAQERNAGGSHQSSGVEMQILGRIKVRLEVEPTKLSAGLIAGKGQRRG